MRLLFWIVPILFASSSLACAQAPNGDARSPGTIGRLAPQEIQPLPRRGPVALAPLPTRNFGGHVYHGRLAWERGRWHHSTRNGRFGWWWDVSGVWYFYPEPSEGPPNYVSDTEVADETASDLTPVAAQPPPEKKSSHVFYYRPGDLKGIPYDGIEECTTARKRAEDVGICVMK